MKLKELTETIATACEVKPKQVQAIQRETFRLIAEAFEKGERVIVPGFGLFTVKDQPQEGAEPKKVVKFRRKSADAAEEAASEDESEDKAPENKKARRAKRKAAPADAAEAILDPDAGEE
jgi:nucleoid DNA-binding protein